MTHTSRNRLHVASLETARGRVYTDACTLPFGYQTVETVVPKKLGSPPPSKRQQKAKAEVWCQPTRETVEVSHRANHDSSEQQAGETGAMTVTQRSSI